MSQEGFEYSTNGLNNRVPLDIFGKNYSWNLLYLIYLLNLQIVIEFNYAPKIGNKLTICKNDRYRYVINSEKIIIYR